MEPAEPVLRAWCALASWAWAAGRHALAYELCLDLELLLLGMPLEELARGRGRE